MYDLVLQAGIFLVIGKGKNMTFSQKQKSKLGFIALCHSMFHVADVISTVSNSYISMVMAAG